MMQGMADRLKEALSLTDDQVTKVQKIDEDTRAEFQKMFTDPNFDRSQMREKGQALMTAAQDKIKAILTDEQKTKFEQWIKDNPMGRMGRGGPGGPGGPGGGPRGPEQQIAEAEKALKLSPDEKSAVMPLVKKLVEARQTARDNQRKRQGDLKDFLKNVPGTTDSQKDEIAAKIKEVRKARADDEAKVKEATDALREVLTPDNECILMSLGILES